MICFPSVGWSITLLYEKWRVWLTPHLDVVRLPILLIPSGENGSGEGMRAIVRGLEPSLRPLLDAPFAFYGHGFGALAAFETCRALEAGGLPSPSRLFVSGLRAPHMSRTPRTRKPIHDLPAKEFLAALRTRGDLPSEPDGQTEAQGRWLATWRYAEKVAERYCCEAEPRLRSPITVFCSLEDEELDCSCAEAWHQLTHKDFEICLVPGGTGFLGENGHLVASGLLRRFEARPGVCRDLVAAVDSQPLKTTDQRSFRRDQL